MESWRALQWIVDSIGQGPYRRTDADIAAAYLTLLPECPILCSSPAARCSREEAPALLRESERKLFIEHLGESVVATGASCLAWAILPSRVGLLISGASQEGVAGEVATRIAQHWASQPRHCCAVGHQPRLLTTIRPVAGAERLLRTVRAIHVSPIRSGQVRSLAELEEYPWTGHAVLMDRWCAEFQDTDSVLALLGGAEEGRQRLTRLMALDILVEIDGMGWLRGPLPQGTLPLRRPHLRVI